MLNNKKWNSEFAGIIPQIGEVNRIAIVNNYNTIQFHIKIISKVPNSYPQDKLYITAYANDFGYNDDTSLKVEERLDKFLKELSDFIFFFNVIQTESYYKATNLTFLKKSEQFDRDVKLMPLPLYNESVISTLTEEMTEERFEQMLIKKEILPDIDSLSKEENDIPPMIVWENKTDYSIFGTVSLFVKSYKKLVWNFEELKKANLNKSNFFDSYKHNSILYVPETKIEELESNLKMIILENEEETDVTDNEQAFMEHFSFNCRSHRLYYTEKDLYNFHTSVKSGNLTILAGMSGTGKSKLVQCYADALGINKNQMLFIPVRPYWQDDADVIGYLDTMNNIYRPGDSGLVNLLTQAANNPNDLFIVCFDEMNIARVEHYFSQLLSVLEMDQSKRKLKLYNSDFTNIYNGHIYPPEIRIGDNILFIGTVNLDESTFQFSDKVLDRANVINLNMIPYMNLASVIKEFEIKEDLRKKQLATESINSKEFSSFRKNEVNINLHEHEAKILWNIHEELQKYNRNVGIGWRIVKQISLYLSNLPEHSVLSREEAFDIQIVQRILTKIRGNNENLTMLIGEFDMDGEIIKKGRLLENIEQYSDYTFKHTIDTLKHKYVELNVYGYTI